ncbi:alpha/beta hydrolase fold protein [Halothermothrix orenii H 168]|uniref:Alpha/beta hydrolase fold protein n=2 Tax=Halothermothrix orenii TaxID=31909 RepID=B8D208_HALOH|nr:alpha/beta hydrolase fold protein [Halothermothrix orenii H 168]
MSLLIFLLCISLVFTHQATAQETISGTWKGAINVKGQTLDITIHIKPDNNGGYLATIDIPAQGVKNYALKNVKYNHPDLYMELPANITGFFNGKVSGARIKGKYTQGSARGTFYLNKKTTDESETRSKDNDTGTEPISLKTETGTIYGTLQLPHSNKKSPVILIIAGSGITDRNGNSPGATNNCLKMLSQDLARAGFASVRYDKRGTGQSKGAINSPSDIRFEHFINDATGWVKKLKKDKRFTGVTVLGLSQGSLVGMIAARRAEADAFISLAGAGRSIDKVLKYQLISLNDDLYQEALDILDKLKQGQTVSQVNQKLYSIFHPLNQPFLISYIKYDPAEEIAKLDIPVLLIHGTNDIQVKKEEANILKKAYPEAKLVLIEGMNHVLKKAPEDPRQNYMTYNNPDLPLADNLVESIVKFLEKVY